MAVKYPEFDADIYAGNAELTVADAEQFLDIKVVDPKKEPYHLKLGRGKESRTVRFAACDRTGGGAHSGNRPFRRALAQRYRDEILRKKWKMNGETFVIDSHGKIVSGQHRFAGLLMAEEERKRNTAYYRDEYGWKGPITIPALVVTGTDPESADTNDLGQKRSAGDVLFRRHEFGGKLYEKSTKKLARILGEAVRLVWLRTGGKLVSDAPYFLHSVMLDEVERHPGLKDCVTFMEGSDGDRGDKRISQYISLSYAAGLMYLFETIKTNRDKWADSGYDPKYLDFKMEDKAAEFFVTLAGVEDQAADVKKDAAIIELAKQINKRKGTDAALSRDAKVAMFVKAYLAWIEGTEPKVKLTAAELADLGSIRLGGLDVIVEPEETEEEESEEAEAPEEAPAPVKKPRKRKKAPKKEAQEPATAEVA